MPSKNNYNNQVFINCPFDEEYLDLFRACIFTIIDSGFIPRCSKEINNANNIRIENIVRLIKECRYGIHDLSRVELGQNELPRFNMPFELGIFYGAMRFGDDEHQKKCSIIFEKESYRYQEFISDISGIDVTPHANQTEGLINKVRDWLRTASRRKTIPSSVDINNRFAQFQSYIRRLCIKQGQDYDSMSYIDLVDNMTDWLKYRDANR